MTTATESPSQSRNGAVRSGDRVLILDAPSWCRPYFTGKEGEVIRVVPFPGGAVWVRFERPVEPWCERMDPVEEFPFSRDQLATA